MQPSQIRPVLRALGGKMSKSDCQIKFEYKIMMRWAALVTIVFLLLITPRLTIYFTSDTTFMGLDETQAMLLSIIGIVMYSIFFQKAWKCPACNEFPGGGWIRDSCKKCGVSLA